MNNATSLGARLRPIVGADALSDGQEARDLASQDIWTRAPAVAALVVTPSTVEELSAVMKALREEGRPIAIRGGGMSYTSGYAPQDEQTVSLDLRRLDRVLDIDPVDMTVTVQAGCTWKSLHEALKPMGLKTPFWGPFSGSVSTVGGAMSQEAIMYGSARHGPSSTSVIAFTVVLADGRILRTGARGAGGNNPFQRHFGPDLTGLFCGDCGALGVKAEVVLRLERLPVAADQASFGFPDRATCVEAMTEMTRAGLTTELFAFDPALAKARLKKVSLRSDIRAMADVATGQGSWLKGVGAAAKVALAGRNFVGVDDYSLHASFEGRSAAAVEADVAAARAIVAAAGGKEIENSLPKVMRSRPFAPLNGVLGAGGERWVPVHGAVALSHAQTACAAVEAVFAERADAFARHDVETGFMLSAVSTNSFVLEAVFLWPESRMPIHDATVEPQVLARLPNPPANPDATAVVAEARKAVVAAMGPFGPAHLQIGRSYAYRTTLDEASVELLDAAKDALDPAHRLNPGVLGFT